MSEPTNVTYAMPSCLTCSHWQAPGPLDGHHGVCRYALHDVRGSHRYAGGDLDWMQECDPEGYDLALRLIVHPVLVMDGSGYKATLYTLPHHYCAAHTLPVALEDIP